MMIEFTIIQMTHEQKDQIILELSNELKELKALVQIQMLRISELEHKKNSKNSSIPSSQDNTRRRQKSLREKSDKQIGGQFGHKGRTKKMIANPAYEIEHKPNFCCHCRTGLQSSLKLEGRRQVIDIPPIKAEYTEHRIYSCVCQNCGEKTTTTFPEGIKGNVSYGPNIEAMAVYMNVRQYMPYQRLQEFFKQLLDIQISQGTFVSFIKRAAKKALPAYDQIKRLIEQSSCVGSDETGCTVNGHTHWYWTWQNEKLTYIVASDSRGFATVQREFPQGLPNSILVSDCLAAQLKQDCKAHQICIAHLYRDLNYLIEKKMEDWSSQTKKLFQKACQLKNEIDYQKFHKYTDQILEIEKQLQQLLHQKMPYQWPFQKQLQKRLLKYQAHILTFLYHKEVPPDNNASERAIRNVKVKQKISGQFKSEQMAQNFAIIRSVVDTCIKRNIDIWQTLQKIAVCQC
jgi:transposase